MTEFEEIVNDLREYETEQEWFEFKENWFNPNELGQYISPLSNSAAYAGQKKAYFVWGIADKPHSIAGISFSPDCRVKNEPLKHYLSRQLSPNNNFEFTECSIEGKTVVLLTIPAAKNIPLSFDRERYIHIGSSKENLRKFPEKESCTFEKKRFIERVGSNKTGYWKVL